MNVKKEKPLKIDNKIKGQSSKYIKQNHNNINDKNCKLEKPNELIILTFFDRSVRNIIPDNSEPISWDDFSLMLSQSSKGTKDGSYFVRTKCNGNRNDENMDSLSPILIIDADHGLANNPCPQPEYVSQILLDLDYQFILYTSFSHTSEIPKYRIIFLLDRMIEKFELKHLYQGIIKIFIDKEIKVKENSESTTWSQPWFLPRYQTEKQLENFFHSDGGAKKFPVDDILSRYIEVKNFSKSEITEDQILKLKKRTPPCITFFSTDTKLEPIEQRNFNLIKMILCAYGISIGLDKAETVSLCQDFIDNYPFSNSLTSPKLRQSNFEKCYDSMKQNGSFFSCATVKALKAPENAFNCKKCSVEQPNTVEEVLKWIEKTEDKKEIKQNWIEKTKGMDAVDTDEVRLAVHKKTGIGKQVLKNDLRTQQKKWQREKIKQIREKKAAKRKAEGKKEILFEKIATGKAVLEMSKTLASYDGSDCIYLYGATLVTIATMRPSSVRMVKRIQDKNISYPDMPIIHALTKEILKHELEKVAYCVEIIDNGSEKDIMWPEYFIKGLMETPIFSEKPLTGIVEHPYIDENFNPVTDKGYDPETGLFKCSDYSNNFNFGDKVRKEQSQKKYNYLCDEVLADFPFATDLDKAGVVSALLTALQRKLITGDS